MVKVKASRRPPPPPPAIPLLLREAEVVLRGLHPQLEVHSAGLSALVSVGNAGVVQISPRRIRILPGKEWLPLSIHDAEQAAAIRARVAAAIEDRGLAGQELTRSPGVTEGARAGRHDLAEWSAALSARGVPSRIDAGRVVVDGVGDVAPPLLSESLKSAAKRFVRQQTEAILPELLDQIRALPGLSQPGVQVSVVNTSVRVYVAAAEVAIVTRYSVTAKGRSPLHADIHRDPDLLHDLSEAVADLTGHPPPAPRTPPAPPRRPPVEAPIPPPDRSPVTFVPRPLPVGPDQMATLDHVVDFLIEGGLQVVVVGDHLVINGIEARPPASIWADPAQVRRWVDSLVEHRFSHRIETIVRRIVDRAAPLRLITDEGDVRVIDPRGNVVARVAATRVVIPEGEDLAGNFLTAGPHWQPVEDRLDAVASTFERDAIAHVGLHRVLPSVTPDAQRAAAQAASKRLREDRTRVFMHTLRVDMGSTRLEFGPIRLEARRAVVPFSFERRSEVYSGGLRLGLLDQLMACRWDQATDGETLALVWSLGLVTYAELTCVAPNQRDPSKVPTTFRPTGSTAQYLSSYVAGHRRRLQPGHRHSADAVANAAVFGIALRPTETWVQPHVRGVPDDAVLHFAWAGPRWLGAR